MKDLPLEELMAQVQKLYVSLNSISGRGDGTAPTLTFEGTVVVAGHGPSGLGSTPREALLDLRHKLLAEADKQITRAQALRETVRSIELP
jgi:hypothetical protein